MILTNIIREAVKQDSIVTVYVYGAMGVGKTSYALWVAHEVLGGWDEVLKYLFFRPEDVIKTVAKAIDRGEKIPIIIMDDAGTWLDRLTWWENEKVTFMKFFNLIRSVAHSVIFTTPVEELPRPIIRKCFIRVNVRRVSHDELRKIYGDQALEDLTRVAKAHGVKPIFSLAAGYLIRTLPSFIQLVRKDFYDAFPTHYPDEIFSKYEKMRREAVRSLLRDWEAELKKRRIDEAIKMLRRGMKKSEVVRYLMSCGMSRATAYRLLARLESLKEEAQAGS